MNFDYALPKGAKKVAKALLQTVYAVAPSDIL